jgi:hypothetical protein
LPTSVALLGQRGFKADPRAVSVECSAAQENKTPPSCPVASTVGSGSASVTATFGAFGSTTATVPFKLFLGVPRQAGDTASLLLAGQVTTGFGTYSFAATGRVLALRAGPYGLELLLGGLHSSLPSNVTITLNKLSLTAGAQRTVTRGNGSHRRTHRYALLTNPPNCNGSWTGKFAAVFSSGPGLSQTTHVPCHK